MSHRFWEMFTRLGAAVSTMGVLGARTPSAATDELQAEVRGDLAVEREFAVLLREDSSRSGETG